MRKFELENIKKACFVSKDFTIAANYDKQMQLSDQNKMPNAFNQS